MALKMQGEKIFYDCFICRRPFQFGPHIYNGRHISAWSVEICDRCLGANWDGFVLEAHPRLQTHLIEKGVPIKLNAKGWLDIPA